MVRIVIDCFGGDESPRVNIEGSIEALGRFKDLELILVGDEQKIKDEFAAQKFSSERISIVHAPDVIDCNEKPTEAVRKKKDSSLMTGIRLLREDDTLNGLVSIGSTGAIVAAATLRLGRVRGVVRPTLCPLLPTMKEGKIVGICDSGATVDCTATQLHQFAIMGSLYLEKVFGVKSPKVALLNVGAEEEKGDELRKEVYQILKNEPLVNFVGNMEGRDLLKGDVDLVVCDGFSGNVMCKTVEGTAIEMFRMIKKDIMSSLKFKIGALFLKKMFAKERAFLDYQNYGGSVLLGASKVVVKGHGSSKGKSFAKCIEQAYMMETGNLNPELEKIFSESKPE